MLVNVLRKILPGWAKRRIRGLLAKVGAHVTEGALAAQNDSLMLLDQKIERIYHEMLERQDELASLLEQNLRSELEARLNASEIESENLDFREDNCTDNEASREIAFNALYEAYIADLPDPTVCELLSGSGDFLAWLSEKGVRSLGCEPRLELHREARARGVTVERQEPRPYLAEQSMGAYDTIICRKAIKRIPDDEQRAIIQEAFRVLREGGRIVLKVAETKEADFETDTGADAPSPNVRAPETAIGGHMSGVGFKGVRFEALDELHGSDDGNGANPARERAWDARDVANDGASSLAFPLNGQQSAGCIGTWVVASK